MQPARAGFFPLDEQLEISERLWSEGVEREVVWLSGAVSSFGLAAEILQRIGGISISPSSIWRCVQAVGAKFRALEEAERERANALPEQWTPPSRAEVREQRLGAALDGAIVNLREEGWKEVKLGAIFEIAVMPTRDEKSGEQVELAHAVHNSYVAHLGGPDRLGEMAWTEARRRGWEQAQDTVVIGDGAAWIWNQAALHFGTSRQVVDWYHAKQHLTEAARLVKEEGSVAYRRWLNSRETLLYQGQAARIADELDKIASKRSGQADGILREAVYFRHNQSRMNYLEMREEEWPIGSGMVESGAKQFKSRFCGPGMRWSRSGAENLLPIRAAVLSQRFDELWSAAQNSPPL